MLDPDGDWSGWIKDLATLVQDAVIIGLVRPARAIWGPSRSHLEASKMLSPIRVR